MRRALLQAAVATSMVAGALGFAAPVAPLSSLSARGTPVVGVNHLRTANLERAAPALRLSGGAARLQAGVLDGITATDIDGKSVDLGKYSSVPAVLVVNVASA